MSPATTFHERPVHVPSIPRVTETSEAFMGTAEEVRTSAVARNVAIALIVGAAIMLASISVWLWYGAHQYQNCL